MNGLGKPFRKNPIKKSKKTVKIKVNSPLVNKKPIARKRIFVQTPFSRSTLILEQKNQAARPLSFRLHFLFRRDQNPYSNLTSKIMKMCEQILKKRQSLNRIQILEIVKKERNLTGLEAEAAIKKRTRQIAGKKPPLILISMIGIERIEDIEHFVQKHFSKPIYFDGIS